MSSASTGQVDLCSGPGEWYANAARPLFDGRGPYDPGSERWLDLDTLLGDGERSLTVLHRDLCEHAPAATASMYLAGWFAGGAAEMVGLALASARAGFLVDPALVRWHLHADGWPERIELGVVEVLVEAGHTWVGQPNVTVAESFDDVTRRTVDRLVDTVAPIIEGCRRLARVGLAGLWNEVGDGLVMVLRRHHDHLDVDEEMLATVSAAAHLDGVPWRAHADLRLIDTDSGRACVGRKGGCCLAYKRPIETCEHRDPEPEIAEFRHRFPLVISTPHYCSTCSLRDRDDAEARQLFWFEICHRRQSQPTSPRDIVDETRSDS